MPLFSSELEAEISRTEVVIMASGPLFLRLGVPSGMEELLEGLAREVLRHQPKDIYRFAATHFEGLLLQRDEAHNAALSPSSTRDHQDGLNHNSDATKVQQQEPVVDDDTPKVDVPLDQVPQSPASDSGAASAASTPASSPVRPPREKNKPQAVRAKLTTTGSPIFQQALQTTFTADSLAQSRSASKSPETPKSGTTSPVENSNSKTEDTDKKSEIVSRPASQSVAESKPTSPIPIISGVTYKEGISSTSPDNLDKNSDNSRFITTPVEEVAKIFNDIQKLVSPEGKSSPSEAAPTSPAPSEENKTDSKSPEIENKEISEGSQDKEANTPQTKTPEVTEEKVSVNDADIVSSPVEAEVPVENVATPASSPNNAEGEVAPEEAQPEVTSSPAPPQDIDHERSASTTSKRISELGSEDFKPQTPEVLIQSPDQSTFDDVSAAVLVEDEPEVPIQPMEVVEETAEPAEVEAPLEENPEVPASVESVQQEEKNEEKSSSPVEEKVEQDEENKEQSVTLDENKEQLPEEIIVTETEENKKEGETLTQKEEVSEVLESKSDEQVVAPPEVESLTATEEEIKPEDIVDIVSPVNLLSETLEEQDKTEDKALEVQSPTLLEEADIAEENNSENVNAGAEESSTKLEEVTENKGEEGEEAVQSPREQDVQEHASPVENVEEVAATPVQCEELSNPETGSPVQVSEILVKDEETGIASEAEDVIPEDKMANFVAMSPEVTADKNEEVIETSSTPVNTDIIEPATSPVENKENEITDSVEPTAEEQVPEDSILVAPTEEIKEPEESSADIVPEENTISENAEAVVSSDENKQTEDANAIAATEENKVPEETATLSPAPESNIEQADVLIEENKEPEVIDTITESEEIKITEVTDSSDKNYSTALDIKPTENVNEENKASDKIEIKEVKDVMAEFVDKEAALLTEETSETVAEQEAMEQTSPVQADPPQSEDVKENQDENKVEEEITPGQSEEVENIKEAKLTSPTPPPSPVQSLKEETILNESVQSITEESEHIDEASGEIEKTPSLCEEVNKIMSEKEDRISTPVPTTSFTPATPPPESPDDETKDEFLPVIPVVPPEQHENVEEDVSKTVDEEVVDNIVPVEDANTEEKSEAPVAVETPVHEAEVNNETESQKSIIDEPQSNENIIDSSQETGEILPVQSSTDQDTVIQVTQEEPTPSDSQSSLINNEGLGAVSSVVIRYSLSEVNENPSENNEEIIKQNLGAEEETDKTDEEILKENQEIADTLIAAVRESEETPTETSVSCEQNNSISEIQASISEPAEVASIQTGSSKDAASLEHDDINKEVVIVEPIDLSALDESDKLEESILISEVSRTDSAAEEKVEETLPTLDSTQFQMDDISIGTAVQDMIESPSSGEQLAKEILLGDNMTQNEEQELEAAATKIQASFRGHQTRKSLNVTEMAQETLVPALVAEVIEEQDEVVHATPAQVTDEVDEEQLLAQTEAALEKAHKRYTEETSSPSAIEELVQTSTLIAATPLVFPDCSPPPTAPPMMNQLRTTYSSSGECADVSASMTEPISWNGGVSRVLDEESGELITPDDDEGVWATLEREIGETQEQENAATKIQAGFRGHRARQSLLQREDAVQIATSSASDVSNTPFSGVRHTGEFHDSLPLLPLSGELPIEQQTRSLVQDILEEAAAIADATNNTTVAQDEADVITDEQLIIADQNDVTSDFDNMSENNNSESFLDKAATKIQATFRGFKSRNDSKQKSPVRTPSPSDIEAATKIQAGFRGYKVRKDMKSSTSPKLARIQSAPEIRIEESEEERSATKIQAGVRGYLTRQRLKKERSPQPPSPEPTTPEMEGAVVKLQAGFRGYKARQDVKLLREGKDVKN